MISREITLEINYFNNQGLSYRALSRKTGLVWPVWKTALVFCACAAKCQEYCNDNFIAIW